MPHTDNELYEFADFRLDVHERLLLKRGERVALPDKAFEILCLLIRQSGRLVGKDALLEKAWAGAFVEENNLDKNISYLRQALGERRGGKLKFIETVRGRGYRFIADVRRVKEDLGFSKDEKTITDGRTIENQRLRTKNLTTNPQSQIANPKSNVVALAGWRHEAGGETQTDGSSALKSAPDATATETESPTLETTAPTAKENADAAPVSAKKKIGVRPLARPAAISVIALLGIAFAFYKFIKPAPLNFEAKKTTRLTSSGRVKLAAISPDGKLVIYSQKETDGQQSLRVKHIGSDSDVQIVAPSKTEYHGLNISPDGNHLYYITEKGRLFQMPVLGGAPKKIVDALFIFPFFAGIGISPDNRRIAFVRRYETDASALFIANADGTNEQRLISFELPSKLSPFPAWSPDGKVIACHIFNAEGHNILSVQAADGTSATVLKRGWSGLLQTAWLPNSRNLLAPGVENDSDSYLWQIWQFSYPDGEASQITNDSNNYHRISLTSDGRVLAAVRTEQAAHIWTMPVDDSTRARQLTAGFEKLDGRDGLEWMPGGKILYNSSPSGKSSIWAVDSGGDSAQLVKNGLYSTISPDGRFIVYHKNAPKGDETGFWRTDTSDGSIKQLTKGNDMWATFSPDGKWIAYTRFGERVGLWKIPVEGGEATQILVENAISPTISPDNKTIAFVLRRAGKPNRIALVSLNGGEIIRSFDADLESNPADIFQRLQWTADGRGIYFVAFNNGVSNIWRQAIDGSPPVQVTDFEDGRIFNFAFSPDGSQLALSRGTFNSDVVLIENQTSASSQTSTPVETVAVPGAVQIQPTVAPTEATKIYSQMIEAEQMAFIREQSGRVENLIEAEPTNLSDEEIRAIKTEIDGYAPTGRAFRRNLSRKACA